MRMAAPVYYSAEMVRELIDEERGWPRYETVHGELLDGDAKRAEVWRADDTFPHIEEEIIRWRAPNDSKDFEMRFADLFAPI